MKTILFKQMICRKKIILFSFFVILSIQLFAQPANNECATAISRTSSTTCSNTTYTINNATASAGIPVGCAIAGTHYDVWFQFTAISSTHTATISSRGTNFTNPEIQLYSGTCGALVSVICGTTTLTATGLTIGNTYYVRVSNVGTFVGTNGGFAICITHPGTPPTNDGCAGATTLTSATSCNNTQYSMRYAAVSAGIPLGCASPGLLYDVWFSFTAVSTNHTATISSIGTSITNPQMQLFSGTCGALVSVACGTTTVTGTGLTIGNVYYVRVINIGTMPTGGNPNSQFNICLTHPNPPPANDDCGSATTLTSGNACTPTTGNLRYATSGSPAGACGGATLTTTFDVWYRFQAVNASQTITVNNLGANLTGASTYMQVLNGTCGALANLGCQTVATTNGRLTVNGLTVGAFYYVRVYVLLSPTAAATNEWDFNICVQHPPANDNCTGAISLTSAVTCINTAGTLDLATPIVSAASGCVAAGTYYDVWYSFVATGVSHTVTLSSLGALFTAPRIQIFSGACGLLVPVGCASATTLTQAGLVPGTTYYVRIANFGVNPSGIGTVANFNICVTGAAAPPSNDLCTGAISLTSNTVCSNISGTLLNATATAGLPACGNNGSSDVWYSFVAQSAYPTITLSTIGSKSVWSKSKNSVIFRCLWFFNISCLYNQSS